MPDTSLTLLDQLRDHCADQAWERLVRLYEPVIRSWLRRTGLQPADADDLAQEVLQRLSQSLANFQHNGAAGSFRSWLRAITLNTVRDYWRRGHTRIEAGDGGVLERIAVADEHDELTRRWDEEYTQNLVHSALKLVEPHFDSKTWDAFRRVTFGGQTPQQVAAALSVSVNVVYLARSRVLRRLREEIRGLLD